MKDIYEVKEAAENKSDAEIAAAAAEEVIAKARQSQKK